MTTRRQIAAETRTYPKSVRGTAVPYGTLSAMLNDKARPYREKIKRGALTWDDSTVLLVQHDQQGIPLARVGAGTLSFTETAGGLQFEATLPDARDDVREALSRGDFDGSVSIGFIVDEDEYQHYEKGSVRTVTRGHLVELSIVTRGAYASAQIGGNDG